MNHFVCESLLQPIVYSVALNEDESHWNILFTNEDSRTKDGRKIVPIFSKSISISVDTSIDKFQV